MDIKDLNVLVVEDDDFQRRVLVRVLKVMGLDRIAEAKNGQGALDIIQNRKAPFDILLCDLRMPGMDGMELIRHLGEKQSKTAVIIVSGLENVLLSSIEIMAQDYGANMLGRIEKPASIKKLEILFNKYLSIQTSLKQEKNTPVSQEFTQPELVNGLTNDEFEPFFQPKVNMVSGNITGAEALARWRHPQKGMIAPDLFIAQMENSSLIDALTLLMIKKATHHSKIWREKGLNITVSVNLSIKSLMNPGFADSIIELVASQKSDPRHMVLEITESAITSHVGRVLENLARLRIHGFGLSIDDYGTGYSSLQQLMRIAYSELKIDKSFITHASTQDSARVIVASSLEMARKLAMTSVAEGVEYQSDWDFLATLGCDVAQGYLISKPLPADEFYDWATEWSRAGFSRK